MEKVLFINCSPNKDGNTNTIGEKLLENVEHSTLHLGDYKIYQYGQDFEDDELEKVVNEIRNYDTIVIGSPIYYYTVSGILKTFIDRSYALKEEKILEGKKLYLFAQGSSPREETKTEIVYLATRLAFLNDMELKGVSIGTADGKSILNDINID